MVFVTYSHWNLSLPRGMLCGTRSACTRGESMNGDPRPLSIGLLGPLSLRLNQTPVTISAPKQRQVLALLTLNAGRVVTVPTLIEELWGDCPPRSYATTLQTYILQLRKALAAANSGNPG